MKNIILIFVTLSCLAGCRCAHSSPVKGSDNSVINGSTNSDPSPTRPGHNGMYALWGDPNADMSDAPYIVGSQIVVQWKQVEPKEGEYDFSAIDSKLKALAEKGFYTTVQINGNEKPAWMFDKIPYIEKKLHIQVRDAKGTLMFWYPAFQKAYMNLLEAYANYLKNTPYTNYLIGVRMNFNAVGTEQFTMNSADAPLSKWVIPKGVTDALPWKSEYNTAYKTAVVAKHVELFADSHIRVFMRNNIDDNIRKDYIDLFKKGKLAWFHTSSEADPRAQGTEIQYITFMDYCRTGYTLGYAEPWASAFGVHGGQTDPRGCQPEQWFYWRLLNDLNCGVSCIGLYTLDLEIATKGKIPKVGNLTTSPFIRQNFTESILFASKYAGYHTQPDKSPGAWVAFRQWDKKIDDNSKVFQDYVVDYSFLSIKLPDKSPSGYQETKGVINVGPKDQRYGAFAREAAVGQPIDIALHPAFISSLLGKTATLRVIYLNTGTSTWQIAWGDQIFTVQNTNSGRFETAEFTVNPIASKNGDIGAKAVESGTLKSRQPKGLTPDLTLKVNKGNPVTFHMVEVLR